MSLLAESGGRMGRCSWRKSDRVLIIGYSPELLNGVSTNTTLLLRNIPYLQLHVAVRCYSPRWKWLLSSVYGLLVFVWRLLSAPPRVIQIIVASRGDTVKTLPYLLLGKMRRCKVSLHFRHNRASILDGLPRWVCRVVLGFWRLSDCYCFLSPRLRDDFDRRLDPRTPRSVIPNPISGDWLRQGVIPYSERTRDLVFLGRWSPEKGKDDLLAAMRTLNVGRPLRCDIYTDYPLKQNLANCDFHEWLNENDVRNVLRESRVLLLPSHFEAYPNVLVQAAACGTPFVSTTLPGILDIAEGSQAGLVHAVGDIQEMQRAIAKLLTDETFWNECSHNGRRWAQSLEVSKVVRSWDRVYMSLGILT